MSFRLGDLVPDGLRAQAHPCWQKRAHLTLREAEQARRLMLRGRCLQDGDGERLTAYKCAHCGRFHVGRMPPEAFNKALRNGRRP